MSVCSATLSVFFDIFFCIFLKIFVMIINNNALNTYGRIDYLYHMKSENDQYQYGGIHRSLPLLYIDYVNHISMTYLQTRMFRDVGLQPGNRLLIPGGEDSLPFTTLVSTYLLL